MKTTIPAVNDYEVRIWYSARVGDECFVAQVVGWPSIMAHGDTHEEAAREIRDALTLALKVSIKHGNPIPDPVHRVSVAAAALGSIGGKSKSPAKVAAVRRNGRLGGRPRKVKELVGA